MSLPITTKRLIIRPFTVADFEAIHAVWSDPAVMAPIPSQPYDQERSWSRLREKFRHQARHGFSKWAVAENARGTVIGECGLHYLPVLMEVLAAFVREHSHEPWPSSASDACRAWAAAAALE